MADTPLQLDDRLTVADVADVAVRHRPIALAGDARARIDRARQVTDELLARGERVYGLTTGVGALKRVSVGVVEQPHFNRLMLLSHRTGTGPLVDEAVVRAAMLAQLAGFARGRSGVRVELADVLVAALNAGLAPHVRTTGSLGQSDLGPLADLAAALVGDGDWGAELARLGLEPWQPTAKEALAFINSNAFTLGWTALALANVEALLDAFDLSAMLTFEGMLGNVEALDPAIADARPVPGLADQIERLRALLDGGTDLVLNLLRVERRLRELADERFQLSVISDRERQIDVTRGANLTADRNGETANQSKSFAPPAHLGSGMCQGVFGTRISHLREATLARDGRCPPRNPPDDARAVRFASAGQRRASFRAPGAPSLPGSLDAPARCHRVSRRSPEHYSRSNLLTLRPQVRGVATRTSAQI